MRVSRIQTRRVSRIGARVSSIAATYLRGGTPAAPAFQTIGGLTGVLVRDAATSGSGAEALSVAIAGLLKTTTGTVIIKSYVDATTAGGASVRTLFRTATPAGANQIMLDRASGSFRVITSNGAGTSTTVSWAVTPSVDYHTFGLRYYPAQLSLWADGAVRGTPVSNPNRPAAIESTATIGYNADFATRYWQAPTAWVVFYDRALSDAEMAAATLGNLPPDFTAHLDFTKGQLAVNQGHPWGITELMPMLLGSDKGP